MSAGGSARTIPSLDGLRAVSILLVFGSHLLYTTGPHGPTAYRLFDHGGLGVRVFFVISGYLITTLLLRERQRGGIAVARFYGRRALRLLPAFYAFVLTVVLLWRAGAISLPPHNLWFVLTYTTNFDPHPTWFTSHLWSLSVEEQFYLLWPLALSRVSLRGCAAIAAAAVLAGGAIRVVAAITGVALVDPHLDFAFPFVCGAIGTGCLVALYEDRLRPRILSRPRLATALAAACVVLALGLDDVDAGAANRLLRIVADAGLAMTMATCVWIPGSWLAAPLNRALPVMAGRLSYSLYLWQPLFVQNESRSVITHLPWNLAATTGVAAASYGLLERPFVALRHRLRLAAPRSTRAGVALLR